MPSSRIKSDLADPILYKLYYGLVMPDILHKLGFDATPENKKILHEFHKRVLGFETIGGRTQEVLSLFILEVTIFWAERGIFARTSRHQPLGLEEKPLKEIWNLL